MPESIATQDQQEQNEQEQQGNFDPMGEIEKLLSGEDQTDEQGDDQGGDQGQGQGDGSESDQGDGDGKQDADKPDNEDDQADGDAAGGKSPGPVDYELKIPLANGEKLSVGELKDFYQQQASREIELQDREQKLRAMLDENMALSAALNVIPENIKQQVQQQRQENLSLEHGRVMTLIPAWKDRATYEADRKDIYSLGQEYGLAEMFQGITDSRAIKFLYDATNLRKRVKAAGLALKQQQRDKPKPKPAPGRIKPGSQQELLIKAKTGGHEDKHRAIESLLGV